MRRITGVSNNRQAMERLKRDGFAGPLWAETVDKNSLPRSERMWLALIPKLLAEVHELENLSKQKTALARMFADVRNQDLAWERARKLGRRITDALVRFYNDFEFSQRLQLRQSLWQLKRLVPFVYRRDPLFDFVAQPGYYLTDYVEDLTR